MNRVTILHLEGRPADAELVRARLEDAGLAADVDRVDNRAAFEAALAGRAYDLILAGDTVPDLDGLAALDLARARRPNTPVVLVADTPDTGLAVEALRRGADDYVSRGRLDRLGPAVVRALAHPRTGADSGDAAAAHRARDHLLSALSHELRTPLNAILGWARLLASGKLPAEKVREAAEVIERNARAQARLLEDLLDASRVLSGRVRLDRGPVDPAEPAEAALAAVAPAAEAKGVQLERDVERGGGWVTGDRGRLQQVVWHLLSNAVQFTPPGGRVRPALRWTETHAELTVSDTGAGFDPGALPHLFDRFGPADSPPPRRAGSLGLGLAVVRRLVELHGGSVRAESGGKDRGATFTVTLPRSTAAGGATPEPGGGPTPTEG